MPADYYKTLNISRDATIDEIRQSYKKLAMKYHPDKNREDPEKAKAQFQVIGEAYETLSDPEKRKEYDIYGSEGRGFRSGGGGGGFKDFQHAQDIFDAFFRDFGSGSSFGRDSSRRGRGGGLGGFHSSFMDDDDDFFNSGFGGSSIFGSSGVGRHFADMDRMFEDMHRGGGGGGMSSFSSMSSSSFGSGGGGTSRSVSTKSFIQNGKKITQTTTTIRHPDGRTESDSNETVEDVGGYIDDDRRGGGGLGTRKSNVKRIR